MPTLPRAASVVIVGGGVMGASTAYHLAALGLTDLVLLEREAFFGLGATGRCAGGIRHQFATDINIRLSQLSLPMLDALEDTTGQPALVRKCGYLFALTREADEAQFRRNVARQRALGVPTEWLTGDEVRRRCAPARFPDALSGAYCAADGLADPNSVVMGYLNAARRLGATCLTGVTVTGLIVESGRLTAVDTDHGRLATPCVVNAAGPWSAPLAALAGLDLPVTPLRRQWLTTTPLPELPPDFPFIIDFARSLYFHREGQGLLTGMSNPDEAPGFDQRVDPAWELIHLEAALERLPLLERAGVAGRCAGLYEVTPDAHPLLGASPIAGFYLITGFSGHGFMHGPICGKLMAELLTTGRAATLDITSLALSRFAEGRALHADSVEYNVV
ncbi:MAG: FAD-binding oxidoreductase [Anaerolineales bacterium]|nr:FAD-binding oxidoreductase [Anaerolineales bacterium]